MFRRLFYLPIVVLPLLVSGAARAEPDIVVGPNLWRIAKSESGPVNYYSVLSEHDSAFIRGRYMPPMKTAVLAYQVPDDERQRAKKLKWSWRAVTLPAGGDECASGKGDSAAVVYVAWKRGLKYYTIKFVWSAVGQKGAVCDSKRGLFSVQDTVILESGGPVGAWRWAEIDLAHQFRHHFEHDDPNASVPDFVGIGLMVDGDQTHSESTGDFGTFVISN